MTDTKGISKNMMAQQFSITDDASPVLKQLKPDTSYQVKNVTNSGSQLQLEIQINGKWEKVAIALNAENKSKNIQISDGKLIINNDGSKITLINNAKTTTPALHTQDILKVLNLLVQPKANTETLINQFNSINNEISLTAQLSKNLKNTLNIPIIKANIQLPPNIASKINLNTDIQVNLQAANKNITAKVFLPKSSNSALEIKLPIEKISQWLKETPPELMVKTALTKNTEIKHHNNITSVSAKLSEKTQQWQNAKLLSSGNSIKISAISPPIVLNLAKNLASSFLNQEKTLTPLINSVKSPTVNDLKVADKVSTEQSKTNILSNKNEKQENPFSKIVNSLKTALTVKHPSEEIKQSNEKLIDNPVNPQLKASSFLNKTPPISNQINENAQLNKAKISIPEQITGNRQLNKTDALSASHLNENDIQAKPVTKASNEYFQKTIPSLINKAQLNDENNLEKSPSITAKNINIEKTEPHLKANLAIKGKYEDLTSKMTTTEDKVQTSKTFKPEHIIGNQKSENILAVKTPSNTPDLNKLVNQAFSRMINPENLSAAKVRTEMLSNIQPNLLNKNEKSDTLNNSLQNLAFSLLNSQTEFGSSSIQVNNQTLKLDQLLQLLFPGLKAKTANIVKEANSKPGIALTQELGQVQQAIQQTQQQLVQSQASNTQTDNLSNTILQFLLPMQLPETVKQTEINLGQYKKNNEAGEQKDVWFIRLNFNFENLGQLEANAQLMDKSVECAFKSRNKALIIKAEPYISSFKQRLIEQGLSVSKISIEHGGNTESDVYKAHSIINIKV